MRAIHSSPTRIRKPAALGALLVAVLQGCEAGQEAHERHDYTGVYVSPGVPVFSARFADGSTLSRDSQRSARVEITDGASRTPTIRITYTARDAASAKQFTIECSGRGTRTPEGPDKEFFTVTSAQCSAAVGSCPMTVEAAILFRAEPVGSRVRSGTWELGGADITAAIPLSAGCRTVPERIETAPLNGFRAS